MPIIVQVRVGVEIGIPAVLAKLIVHNEDIKDVVNAVLVNVGSTVDVKRKCVTARYRTAGRSHRNTVDVCRRLPRVPARSG